MSIKGTGPILGHIQYREDFYVSDDDEIMTTTDVATVLKVPAGTLKQWRSTGRGPRWFRLSERSVRYRRSDVDAWLAAQYGATA